LMKTWFGRFATQLDPVAAQQLPEPLTEDETPDIEDFMGAMQVEPGLVKDPVCRFAYAQVEDKTLLYINGAIWETFGASDYFMAKLANQSYLTQDELLMCGDKEGNIKLLFDLWKLQYLVFIE
jgi:50S ribosomal protein L16 3-hydroxylase